MTSRAVAEEFDAAPSQADPEAFFLGEGVHFVTMPNGHEHATDKRPLRRLQAVAEESQPDDVNLTLRMPADLFRTVVEDWEASILLEGGNHFVADRTDGPARHVVKVLAAHYQRHGTARDRLRGKRSA